MRRSKIDVMDPDHGAEIRKIRAAVGHANAMYRRGLLTEEEFGDVIKLAASMELEHIDMEQFSRLSEDGGLDRIRAIAGYGKGEDPEAIEARRAAAGQKVVKSYLHNAVGYGEMTEAQASQHAPQDSGEVEMSDAELDAAIKPVLDETNKPRTVIEPQVLTQRSD
jgi:hypothetical protein